MLFRSGECTSACKMAVCGDSLIWENIEQCDDGPNNGDDKACLASCKTNVCGDGKKGPNEQCDDGNMIDSDNCTTVCKLAACGDGFVQPGEQCDAGAMNSDMNMCTSVCKTNVCGDSLVYAGVEQCDDGNMSNTDACVMGCKTATCGDGFILMGTEECDDKNMANMDGCDSMCKLENAAIVTLEGINKSLLDGQYDGTQAKMVCVDIDVAKAGLITGGSLKVGMAHTYVGDLTFKLFSPGNAQTLVLMSMPGVLEAADNGQGFSGENANLDKLFPIVFRDPGVKDAEKMGDGSTDTAWVVCKSDNACDYFPNKGSANGLNTFAGLAGVQSMGLWKFCVGDSVSVDTGTIDSVTLTLTLQ